MKVKIGLKDCIGEDEIYAEWFICPNCQKTENILDSFNFCPECGAELIWENRPLPPNRANPAPQKPKE